MENGPLSNTYNSFTPDVKHRLDNREGTGLKINPWILYFFIIILPFILFLWMLPFVTNLTLGRDSIRYFVWHQMEYLFALKSGTFPLFYHFVSGGLPSHIWAGYGHAFLPIPYIISLLPGYWTGQAIQWNMLSLMLVIPVAHISILQLIKKSGIRDLLSLFLSTVTVYPAGLLLLFRYGNGLNAWIGHLLLCSAIGFYFLNPSRIRGPLTIIGATYWLVNSGHPEIVYFAMLGSVVFTLFFPFFLEKISSQRKVTIRSILFFWGKTGVFVAIGIVLSAAYLVPVYFDAVKTLWFSQHNYPDVCVLTDTFAGFINNFFSPLRSSSFAAFGGNPLLIAALLIPILRLVRVKVPVVIWCILALIIFVCLFMLGDHTPVHFFLWKYLPFASATRIPGRISLILPVLFLLLLVWIFRTNQVVGFKSLSIPVPSFLALCSLLIFVSFIAFVPDSIQSKLCQEAIFNINGIPPWVEPTSFSLTIILLVLLAAEGALKGRWKETICLIVCLVGCLHLALLFKFNPLPFKILDQNDIRTYSLLASEKEKTLDVFSTYLYPHDKMTRIDLLPQFENYFLEPYLATIYRKYIYADNRNDAYEILNHDRKKDEVVIEKFSGEPEPDHTAEIYGNIPDMVKLVYSSYNRLVFKAQTVMPSFFILSYQETGHWRAFLNGKRTPVWRANGYALAVPVPAGNSTLEFKYWSWAAFWGMAISCFMLALLGVITGMFMLRKRVGLIVAVISVFLAVSLFLSWYQSLYAGDNLHTSYSWATPAPDASENIAFGKPTRMSSNSVRHPYMHNSRHGVDGGRIFASCFITDWQPVNRPDLVGNPWWEVDLKCSENIQSIVLYASVQGEELDKMIAFSADNTERTIYRGMSAYKKIPVHYNKPPITIGLSTDHVNWQFASINQPKKGSPLKIRLEEPVQARYVRITAKKPCRLCLDEVEVYTVTENDNPPPVSQISPIIQE